MIHVQIERVRETYLLLKDLTSLKEKFLQMEKSLVINLTIM